ncbi:MAG TPA: BatA domain-containing protein, partial [Candidatus Nanopelagicales bacterium]|nr:BatA domain-containing protein [Candidatus Nanopelagicales bacterium]
MSFLSGWRLLFLLAPIALLAAYLIVQRRRHAQVVRFTSVDLLDSVAPQRSGWQRHLPAAGVLLSLVAMTIAFAQPVMAVPVPLDRATILLTLD